MRILIARGFGGKRGQPSIEPPIPLRSSGAPSADLAPLGRKIPGWQHLQGLPELGCFVLASSCITSCVVIQRSTRKLGLPLLSLILKAFASFYLLLCVQKPGGALTRSSASACVAELAVCFANSTMVWWLHFLCTCERTLR